ncbi:MAG: PIN domain-containing protein [archaeon]|nr:PIN domain-containing protein [archaeon]
MEHLTRIALDTNVLLSIEKFKVDVFSQLRGQFGKVEFLVPKSVVEELEKLGSKSMSLKKSSNVALELLKKNKAKTVEKTGKNADEDLLALSSNAWIATSDKKLLKKVLQRQGRVLILRQKKFMQAN